MNPNTTTLLNIGSIGLNCFCVLCCVIILGLTLKLYTEYFKDRAISSRKPNPEIVPERAPEEYPSFVSSTVVTSKTKKTDWPTVTADIRADIAPRPDPIVSDFRSERGDPI